ncbi:hypothetical protein AADW59_00100 [Candidatus Hodgkinia cicadicola]
MLRHKFGALIGFFRSIEVNSLSLLIIAQRAAVFLLNQLFGSLFIMVLLILSLLNKSQLRLGKIGAIQVAIWRTMHFNTDIDCCRGNVVVKSQ